MASVSLKDEVWKRILREIEVANSKQHVRVGVLAEKGGDATEEGSDITMIELAAIHEFGSPAASIPARPFMRSTFRRVEPELIKITSGLASKFVRGEIKMERALGQIGAWAVAKIRETIRTKQTGGPENKPATVKAKGSSTPLVDTGRLINAITWLVSDKEGS